MRRVLSLLVPVLAFSCGARTESFWHFSLEPADAGADGADAMPDAPSAGFVCTAAAGATVSIAAEVDLGDRWFWPVALRPDGGLLAATDEFAGADYYRVAPDGAATLIKKGGGSRLGDSVLSPNGDGFVDGDGLYDDTGTLTGTLPAYRYALMSSTGRRVLVGSGTTQIIDRRGAILATLSGFGDFAYLFDDGLIGATDEATTRFGYDGALEWAMPFTRPEAVSLDGQVVILHAGSSILHYAHGIRIGETSIPSPSWDIALSRNGHHSAVSMSTPSRVMVFSDGAVVRALTTGLEYTTSIAVNDLGELAVGGQANDGTSTVLLFDGAGHEALRCEGAKTNAGYNPCVLLEPSGIALLTYYPKGIRLSRLAR